MIAALAFGLAITLLVAAFPLLVAGLTKLILRLFFRS